MTKDNNIQNEEKSQKKSGQDMSYILFLILILLFMGGENTFNKHFQLLDREITLLNNMFKTFSATANSLQNTFATPAKIMEEMDI